MGGAQLGMSNRVPADLIIRDRTPTLFQQNQQEMREARSANVNRDLVAAGGTEMLFNISHLAKEVFLRPASKRIGAGVIRGFGQILSVDLREQRVARAWQRGHSDSSYREANLLLRNDGTVHVGNACRKDCSSGCRRQVAHRTKIHVVVHIDHPQWRVCCI